MTSTETDPSIYELNLPHQIQTEYDMPSQEYRYKAKHETIATHIGELSAPTYVEEEQQQRQIQPNDQQTQHQIQPPQSQQAVQPPSQEAKSRLTRPVGDKLKRKLRFPIPECIPQQPLEQEKTTWSFEAADLKLMEALNFPPSKPSRLRRKGASWHFKRGSKRLKDMFDSSEERINPRLYCKNNPTNGDTANSLQSTQSPAQIQQNNQICSPNGSNQPGAGSNPQVPETVLISQVSNINPVQGTGAVSRWKRLKKFIGLGQKF
ncbi:hypothetical protein OWV82_015469 [Melia azedarach]|uniref:Uncharacterized protein n=1 Tax=Melia azedarach TaxID=155640 RepID=A0ACC1XPF9_MELAZ|nr:hypothetical protein OWV82_015469 [Melia azedarach]